jgi:rare lipoprotein A
LPLGTIARVTNLKNGKSAVVAIQDRGPYVADRIVDLSPKTAEDLGIKDEGVAMVEVAPISVPLPDGRVLTGDAAREAGEQLSVR